MKILTSKDYTKFHFDGTNRPIRSNPRLRKSMKVHGWLDAYPAHVVKNGAGYIIKDGQHRFLEAEKLGLPVKFVVCNDGADIAVINDTQRPWLISDHVHSRAAGGDPHYQYLLQFSKSHDLPVGISASVLCGTDVKNGMGRAIRSGRFEVKCSEHAERVALVVNAARKHVRWASHHLFIDAIRRCFGVKGFDANRLVKKINAHPGMLITQANLDGFLKLIEDIYNRNSQDKLSIVFAVKNA